MAVGLRGNDRSLNARQKLLRFWQGQTQARNIAKACRAADLCFMTTRNGEWCGRRGPPGTPSKIEDPIKRAVVQRFIDAFYEECDTTAVR